MNALLAQPESTSVRRIDELGRIIIAAIGSRDDPSEQGRLAAQVRDIAGRFPVPGLADA